MGYTIKQKIDICWKAESNPQMTQSDLANWAMIEYGSSKPPSQTTISRILSSKNDLIASKEAEFQLVRRRKQSNPLLRRILTEWITQATWENIPITTPVIQSTANAIWTRLPTKEKDGNGIFNQKWCNHFLKRLNIDLTGSEKDVAENPGHYKLNKVWKLDDKIELKSYIRELAKKEGYKAQDIFTIDEFQLFYSLPLDQIFDVSSIDKGLKQSSSAPANSLTIMLGCNIDGTEKLMPLIVGNYDKFAVSKSSNPTLKNLSMNSISQHNLMNKLTEIYQVSYKSNTNKWITSSMFQNYLLTLEHKLTNISPKRKILIILDDSSSHRTINLKFSNIKLCYLKNNANHKNPYHSSYNGIKFDYLPMNFGIVEEFKILYRLQQYLEMINLQRTKSKGASKADTNTNENEPETTESGELIQATKQGTDLVDFKADPISTGMEVLSESDYNVPLIKVIEWIKRAWDSVSEEKIFLSWRKTNLLDLGRTPRAFFRPTAYNQSEQYNQPKAEIDESLHSISKRADTYNPNRSYNKLAEIMNYLNVVIPWEIDDLLGLVNERAKITLSYVSIEEIIGSCLSDTFGEAKEPRTLVNVEDVSTKDEWFGDNFSNDFESKPDQLLMESAYSALMGVKNGDSNYNNLESARVENSPFAVALEAKNELENTAFSVLSGRNGSEISSYGEAANQDLENSQFENSGGSSLGQPVPKFSSLSRIGSSPSLPPIYPKLNNLQSPVGAEQTEFSAKHRIDTGDQWVPEKKTHLQFQSYPVLKSNGPSIASTNDSVASAPSPSIIDTFSNTFPKAPFNKIDSEKVSDYDLTNTLSRLIEFSNNDLIKLSPNAIEELRSNIRVIQERNGMQQGDIT